MILSIDLTEQQETVRGIDLRLGEICEVFGLACRSIPVEVMGPADLCEILEPDNRLLLNGILHRVEIGAETSQVDLQTLLRLCGPRYFHPGPRILITWAPALAQELARRFPRDKSEITEKLAPSQEEAAAIIAHEKYGHGYLYLETKLGQQLVHILSDDELYQAIVTGNEPAFPNSPWKRDFFEENQEWLLYLLGSAFLVEEGFASWVHTRLLLCLGGSFAVRAAYKLTRHPFSLPLEGFIPFRPYFQARGYPLLDERVFSPHKQGYDLFDHIYELLGYSCIACVLEVARMVMNVDFGISRERDGVIHLSMRRERMESYLKNGKPRLYLADQRLATYRRILWNRSSELEEYQRIHPCPSKRTCDLSPDHPCSEFLESIGRIVPQQLMK